MRLFKKQKRLEGNFDKSLGRSPVSRGCSFRRGFRLFDEAEGGAWICKQAALLAPSAVVRSCSWACLRLGANVERIVDARTSVA